MDDQILKPLFNRETGWYETVCDGSFPDLGINIILASFYDAGSCIKWNHFIYNHSDRTLHTRALLEYWLS